MPPKSRKPKSTPLVDATKTRSRPRSRSRSPVRPIHTPFLNGVPFIHFMYGHGLEGRLETRTRPIVLLETPAGSWPTTNIAFYKSTGTSNEGSDYRSGTWFPIYGFGMSPREIDATTGTPLVDELGQPYAPKFLKMMDYKSPPRFPVIVEIDQLRVLFYDWLDKKRFTRVMIEKIMDEIFNKVVYLYFANNWQIKSSICLSLKRDLNLSEFESHRDSVEWINNTFHDCVWKMTINGVNFLDFVHFFLLVVRDIPAYPEIVQDINDLYDKKQAGYLAKLEKGTLSETDINDAKFIRFLNDNEAQMPLDTLMNPNMFLEFRPFYAGPIALQYLIQNGADSKKGGRRKTYRKKGVGGEWCHK